MAFITYSDLEKVQDDFNNPSGQIPRRSPACILGPAAAGHPYWVHIRHRGQCHFLPARHRAIWNSAGCAEAVSTSGIESDPGFRRGHFQCYFFIWGKPGVPDRVKHFPQTCSALLCDLPGCAHPLAVSTVYDAHAPDPHFDPGSSSKHACLGRGSVGAHSHRYGDAINWHSPDEGNEYLMIVID